MNGQCVGNLGPLAAVLERVPGPDVNPTPELEAGTTEIIDGGGAGELLALLLVAALLSVPKSVEVPGAMRMGGVAVPRLGGADPDRTVFEVG